ncbi:MAG: glycosyltransferase family 4 protein [Labilithrix sp.]|nr:glycosyltransferase family 4 protein [Labilithrix sp.]
MKGAVVHVVVAGEIGGAERMLVDLARSDANRAHSVALLTPNPQLRAMLRDAGVALDDRGPVREGPLSYLSRSLGPHDVGWLCGVLRDRRAAVVHLHTFASQVLGTRAALHHGARIVRTEHSTRVYDDPSCWPFSRWSLERADAVVCISEHVRDVARAKASWIDARVVPNGVDVDRFAPAPAPDGRPDGAVRFIALGRLDRRKGLDIALEALALVPRAELDVVGEGDQAGPLMQLASRLGVARRVRFRGFAGDVRDAIATASVGLSSARAEGLGIALLEAMAMGRPIVALPTGGVPEIVRDGDTGWLAHGRSADALARVMAEAIERPDEVSRRGERARRNVVARYSIDAMRQGYEAVYASLPGPSAD